MISLKKLLTEGALNEDIKKDIDKFIDKLNKQFPDQEYTVSSGGGKYVRINHKSRKFGGESAWGFIALVDNPSKGFQKGDLLKAAGYNTPAKNSRGNILNGTAKYDKYSPAYLREETLTEKKYYVTYNKGRGQGKDLEKEFDQKTFKTTNKPKVFNSYNDAKKYAEKMEKIFRNSIGGGTAYWVSDEKMNPIKEAKSDYEVYHKSYTSAINAARDYAEKKGYEINDDDAFRQIGMGPRKPSEGKTNRFSIELSKDGKVQRKKLQIQVYGMRNSYELNAYIQ